LLKFLHEYLEAFFLGVAMELLLGEETILLHQTRITAQKGCNFFSDYWIALKFLEEFPEAIFLGVGMELLLGEEEACSC
jgi:hypothetical protein